MQTKCIAAPPISLVGHDAVNTHAHCSAALRAIGNLIGDVGSDSISVEDRFGLFLILATIADVMDWEGRGRKYREPSA